MIPPSPTLPNSPSLTSPFHSPKLFASNLGTESQDLATDYEDLANSIEGLGFLESGITEPLNRFAATSMEWARLQRNNVSVGSLSVGVCLSYL
jgi:sorting nexin-4